MKTLNAIVAATILAGSGAALASPPPSGFALGPEGAQYRYDPKFGRLVQPLRAQILSGGPGSGNIRNTIDIGSLSGPYVSHATPWDGYFDSYPTHTQSFPGYEWFSETGSMNASVRFLVTAKPTWVLSAFALWNEESSGFSRFELIGPDGEILIDTSPKDNPLTDAFTYTSEQWKIKQYFRGWFTLNMYDCPQPDPASFPSCAIGEVAFGEEKRSVGNIPEPTSWAMMIAGFGLVGAALRRRRAEAQLSPTG